MATAVAGLPPLTAISTLSITPLGFFSSGKQGCAQIMSLSEGMCLLNLKE